jgi:hypothetical protein
VVGLVTSPSTRTALAATAPAYTTSRYITAINNSQAYTDGCTAGQSHPYNAAWIEDFGEPWWTNGVNQTVLLQSQTTVNFGQITGMVEQWMLGFYNCAPANAYGGLYVGVNNYGIHVDSGMGGAWGSMINTIDSWASSKGYAGKIYAYGAIDAELSWNPASSTRAWTDGYR